MTIQTFKPIAFAISLTALLVLIWVNIALLLGKPAPIELSFVSIFLVLFPLWAFTIYYLQKIYTEAEYQALHSLHLRSVTGFFLSFFSVSTVVLAPWRRSSKLPVF